MSALQREIISLKKTIKENEETIKNVRKQVLMREEQIDIILQFVEAKDLFKIKKAIGEINVDNWL